VITGPTVAPVATVAVAKPQNVTVEPIPPAATLAELEAAANRFCDAVGDDDEPRAVMLKDCREFPAERRSWLIDYLIDQAEMHKPATRQADITEELRRCTECRNLARSGVCLAASRGEPMVGLVSRHYHPARPDQLRRCECYLPGPDDTDQRPGNERWPGLMSHSTATTEGSQMNSATSCAEE
jgi:hypothetical protein